MDFFFLLLSGFLMVWVHRRDFNQPSRLGRYFTKRVTRIYPIYWVLCGFLIPMTLLVPSLRQNQVAPTVTSFASSILLLPSNGTRLLNVTWTLEYELLFYLAFSVFFFSARAGVALFSLWFAAIAAAAVAGPIPLIPTGAPQFRSWILGFLLNLHIAEFFLGMVLAWLVQRGFRLRYPQWWLAAGIVLGVGLNAFAFMKGSHTLYLEQGHRIVTLSASFTAGLIVLSAVLLEHKQTIHIPDWLRLLGAASYSIYLTHFLVISLFRVLAVHFARIAAVPATLLFGMIVVTGLIPGVVLHLLVERPLLAFTSDKFRVRTPQSATM